jgi:DNA polymerase III sliding clamp (beta) subunit (PCNA family)
LIVAMSALEATMLLREKTESANGKPKLGQAKALPTNGAARAKNGHDATVEPRANIRTRRKEWARQIRAELQSPVQSHVRAGRLLIQAKEDLKQDEDDDGEFLEMLKEELGFKNPRKPQMLMAIAHHRIISKAKHASLLPAGWYTLYLLTQIPDELLLKMLADGRIHPEMERKDAEQIIKKLKKCSPLGSLIAKLETVEPAISKNPIIPLFTHYWFTGDKLLTNNGQIAIQVPFASDFADAVPSVLLDLIKAAGFKGNIKLASKDGNLLITEPQSSGGVRMTLKMLQPTFPFAMPERKQTNSAPQVIAELVEAIRYCMRSVGTDTSHPEYLGITLERDGKRIMLYSSDGSTISRTSISDQLPLEKRAILPSRFCEQMVRLYDNRSEGSEASFEIGETPLKGGKFDRYALFTAGDVKLYGRIIEARRPYDFNGVVAWHLPKGYEKKLVDIPERLRKAVALASGVCNERRLQTRITVSAGQLCLVSKDNDAGVEEVEDVIPLASAHDDVTTVVLEPKQLRHISNFDKMLVTTKCIIMTKTTGNELHLVSCCTPREGSPVAE